MNSIDIIYISIGFEFQTSELSLFQIDHIHNTQESVLFVGDTFKTFSFSSLQHQQHEKKKKIQLVIYADNCTDDVLKNKVLPKLSNTLKHEKIDSILLSFQNSQRPHQFMIPSPFTKTLPPLFNDVEFVSTQPHPFPISLNHFDKEIEKITKEHLGNIMDSMSHECEYTKIDKVMFDKQGKRPRSDSHQLFPFLHFHLPMHNKNIGIMSQKSFEKRKDIEKCVFYIQTTFGSCIEQTPYIMYKFIQYLSSSSFVSNKKDEKNDKIEIEWLSQLYHVIFLTDTYTNICLSLKINQNNVKLYQALVFLVLYHCFTLHTQSRKQHFFIFRHSFANILQKLFVSQELFLRWTKTLSHFLDICQDIQCLDKQRKEFEKAFLQFRQNIVQEFIDKSTKKYFTSHLKKYSLFSKIQTIVDYVFFLYSSIEYVEFSPSNSQQRLQKREFNKSIQKTSQSTTFPFDIQSYWFLFEFRRFHSYISHVLHPKSKKKSYPLLSYHSFL